jgi:hypothetical protein
VSAATLLSSLRATHLKHVPFELDHVFLASSKGAPQVEALLAAGFAEGAPNAHPGQGTACRRIVFGNAYLELIWIEDLSEATSTLVEPTGLALRLGDGEGVSHVGVCLRARDTSALSRGELALPCALHAGRCVDPDRRQLV